MTATHIVKAVLIAYYALSALGTVALVGHKTKGGKEYTSADGVAAIVFNAVLIYLIWWL
jgi:hypothetical protein